MVGFVVISLGKIDIFQLTTRGPLLTKGGYVSPECMYKRVLRVFDAFVCACVYTVLLPSVCIEGNAGGSNFFPYQVI